MVYLGIIVAAPVALIALIQPLRIHLGLQPDGGYFVSTGQRIDGGAIRFSGRPSDMAPHPSGHFYAVMKKDAIFLCRTTGIVPNSEIKLGASAGPHGLIWTPDGMTLIASTASGYLQTFGFDGVKLATGPKIVLTRPGEKLNPVPCGLAVTHDGKSLFVAAGNLNAIVEVDLTTKNATRRFPVETLPFDVKLTADEKTLVASNWGGRIPTTADATAMSQDLPIVVDKRGAPSSGTVTLIEIASGTSKNIPVGIHPSSIAIDGSTAYIANTMSDSISIIDLVAQRVEKTIPIKWGKLGVIGAMPSALQLVGNTLFVCDGGDNAICEIDKTTRHIRGFRPAGFFPVALCIEGETALVLNSKGNGSVANTSYGRNCNSHDFEGAMSVSDLSKDLKSQTAHVARNNHWDEPVKVPNLAVYHGAIQHVLYIVKENRTYDEIFGDMPEGNGDIRLCDAGQNIMPNHHAIVRNFTLFDNAYVSGTNSADGHAWVTQSLANDCLEHFYVGYSRTYPFEGSDAMSISTGGCIWDAALAKHKTFRDYGEFCVTDKAEFQPRRPKNWFEAWEDRASGRNKFTFVPHAQVASLQPYICPRTHYWPLVQSDQSRADEFLHEYAEFSKSDTVPNLMILGLPSDHTAGLSQDMPTPRAMLADNDLALGRVIDAVSHSPQWKNTCIFVIEDDAQAGLDHVDGHRTSFMVISPYNKRHTVDSNMYTTTNMIRSIEMMLGLDPMNRFDMLSRPIDSCFRDTADLTPYSHVPNNIQLDEHAPSKQAMTIQERFWQDKTMSLDWSRPDGPNSNWLNRIIWASNTHGKPYPGQIHAEVGRVEDDD